MNTTTRMNPIMRELNDEELDAVSGGCSEITCHGVGGGTPPSKGWVADTVAAVQRIVYGKSL